MLKNLEQQGLGDVLRLALQRYKRDATLGKVSQLLEPKDAAALERLIGKPVKHLDLAQLDQALRQSRFAVSLLEVLEALNGAPIQSAKQQRLEQESAFAKLLETATDQEWREMLEQQQAGATRIVRALREQQISSLTPVAQAIASLRRNPERLPALATRILGHAHGFDADTLFGQLLLEAVSALHLEPPLRDGVSSSVLIANLFGYGCVHLPWREVVGLTPQQSDIWLLENPAVFEAMLDAGCQKPLICTQGQPSAACMALLAWLEGRIFAAFDFDIGGLRIAKRLSVRFPERFVAWGFDATAYQRALELSGGFELDSSFEAFVLHFPELVAAMQAKQRGAHQEALLEWFAGQV